MTAPLLSQDTLARFRAIQEANMPSEADLITFALTRADGAITGLTPVVRATVPCRVAATTSSNPLVAEQPTLEIQYVITMPVGTDVVGVSRLVVRSASFGIPAVTEMVVIGPVEPRSYEASTKVLAKRATDVAATAVEIGTVTVVEA